MSNLALDEAISQAFEAFCVLSDAQEHVSRYIGLEHPANKLINHAKLHLLRIVGESYPPTGIRLTCSLEEAHPEAPRLLECGHTDEECDGFCIVLPHKPE